MTLLGLPRGFRGVLSSLLSILDLRVVILILQIKRKLNQQLAHIYVLFSITVSKEALPAFQMKINLGHSELFDSPELIQNWHFPDLFYKLNEQIEKKI